MRKVMVRNERMGNRRGKLKVFLGMFAMMFMVFAGNLPVSAAGSRDFNKTKTVSISDSEAHMVSGKFTWINLVPESITGPRDTGGCMRPIKRQRFQKRIFPTAWAFTIPGANMRDRAYLG